MSSIPNLNEEKIVDVLMSARVANDYQFDLTELCSVLKYTIMKASGKYREDSKMFAALLESELHDYVMRKRFNDKEEREAKRCVNFAIPTRI